MKLQQRVKNHSHLRSMSAAAKSAYAPRSSVLSEISFWRVIAVAATVVNALAVLYIAYSSLEFSKADTVEKELLLLSIDDLAEQKRSLQSDIVEISAQRSASERLAEDSRALAALKNRELGLLNRQLETVQSQIQIERNSMEVVSNERDNLIEDHLRADLGERTLDLIASDRLAGFAFSSHSHSNSYRSGVVDTWRHPVSHYFPATPEDAHEQVMEMLGLWLAGVPTQDRPIAEAVFQKAELECSAIKRRTGFRGVGTRPTLNGDETLEQIERALRNSGIGIVSYNWSDGTSNDDRLKVYRDDLIDGYVYLFNAKKNLYLANLYTEIHRCLGLTEIHLDIRTLTALDRNSISSPKGEDLDIVAWMDERSYMFRVDNPTVNDPNNRFAIRRHVANQVLESTGEN